MSVTIFKIFLLGKFPEVLQRFEKHIFTKYLVTAYYVNLHLDQTNIFPCTIVKKDNSKQMFVIIKAI